MTARRGQVEPHVRGDIVQGHPFSCGIKLTQSKLRLHMALFGRLFTPFGGQCVILRYAALAADITLGETCLRLFVALSCGHGVKKNNIEAVFWFRMAARQGHKEAQASLVKRYISGKRGVPL